MKKKDDFDIVSKIREEMAREKINGRELAEKSGVNYNTLMGFLRRRSSSLSTKKLELVLSALNLRFMKFI